MYEYKTKRNESDVLKYINSLEHKTRREDGLVLLDLMTRISGAKAEMWGESIIGFGIYHYKSKSMEGDWMKIGFAPRKAKLSIYLMNGFSESEELLEKLGKHKLGKGCLYINKLADVDMEILKKIIEKSIKYMSQYDENNIQDLRKL